MFLLGSTWLALHIWITEHGIMIAAATLCVAQPAHTRLRRPVPRAGVGTPTAVRPCSNVGQSTRQ